MISLLQKNSRHIKKVKNILAVLLGLMILIDIGLVALGPKGWPTFSKVVLETQSKLIWLSFLFGGLVAKIYYNRKVRSKDQEILGFTLFLVVVFLLFLLGHYNFFPDDVSNEIQSLILVMGGIFAYGVWPQYIEVKKE